LVSLVQSSDLSEDSGTSPVSTGVVDTVLEYEMRGFEMLEFACEVPLAAPPEWKQGLGTHSWECLEPQVDRRCTAAAMLSLE